MTTNLTKNQYRKRFSALGMEYHYSGKAGRGFAHRPVSVSCGRMFYGADSPDIMKIIFNKFRDDNPQVPYWAIR